MAKLNQSLTSVKVNSKLFDEFKIESIRTKLNFQKLCDRSMYLYLHDDSFRELIHNTNQTEFL